MDRGTSWDHRSLGCFRDDGSKNLEPNFGIPMGGSWGATRYVGKNSWKTQQRFFNNPIEELWENNVSPSRKLCGKALSAHSKTLRNTPRRRRKEQGTAALLFVLAWFPLFAVFTVILWLNINGLRHLKTQREIDRCLFPILTQQCKAISSIAKQNQILRILRASYLGLEAASKVPFPPTAIAAGSAKEALRAQMLVISQLQKLRWTETQILRLSAIRCGFPRKNLSTPLLKTATNYVALKYNLPPGLEWNTYFGDSEISVFSLRTKKKSFGFCKASGIEADLQGENYRVSFEEPDKFYSRPSLPWRRLLP